MISHWRMEEADDELRVSSLLDDDATKDEESVQNDTGAAGLWPAESWDYCFNGYC